MLESKQNLAYDDPSKTFLGVRFILLGFDLVKEDKVRSKLLGGGGIDAVNYGPDCNHVIVDKLVYDDPICIAAQRDGKTLVTGLWVDHSFDVGMPVDPTSVMYKPMRDLNGIPGAKSLVVCLTGYQRQDRDDIMTMVALTGANFSKPLVANKVTHLICYKFEGEKYELAKKIKKIKLVNHRWLEDCLKAWKLLPEADYAKSGYELEMEVEAKDSEEETEDMASMDVRKKSVVSPQNTRVANKSAHQSPVKQEVSRNSFYLSASESLANVGDTSKIQLTPRKEIDCGIASFSRETHDKHCARSPGKISSEVPPSMLDGTMISEKVEHVLASASGSAKKSPGVGLSKLSSKSWKPSLPLRSERTENNSGSPSASNVNKPGFSGGFGTPSETPQDGTDSHGVKTPLKGTLLHLDEGQTVTLPSKRKTTVSHGSSRSPMSSHYPKTSMESGFATKTMEFPVSGSSLDGSHGIAGDIYPPSVTCRSREETSLAPIEALNISHTSENRKECNDQVLQCSRERLKKQTLSNLDVKDISSGGTNNCTGGVETHQSDLQSIEEKMDGQAALNFSKVEHSDAQLKPTKKKMLAKKTLGSRPTICKGSTTRHKGLINAILQNEYISHSNGTVAMEDAANATITEKVVMVSPTTNEDGPVDDETKKAPDDEWQNEFDMGSNKENSAEVEAPHSGKDATPTKKQADSKTKQMEQGPKSVGVKNSYEAEKFVCSKKTELPESKSTGDGGEKNITKGKKHPLTKSKTNALPDPREKVKNDGSKSKQDEKETVSGNEEIVTNGNEAEKSVCSKKTELPESKSTGDGGEKNLTKGKKRPLTKSKTNKLKDSREKVKNDGSKSKQDEKKTVPGNEEMVVLAGRTNARPSKKVKSSADVGKENNPATIRQQSVSSGTGEAGKVTSEVLKKHLKNGFKADKTNPGNLGMKPEPAWFILSGHKLQRKEFQQVIRQLKGRVCRDSHHWSYQATHFIVPDPIRRTEKFFAAAASGSWILKTDYLTASNEAGRFLSEEPYEWHKKCLTEDGAINLEAPRKWRFLRERTGHGAFYGMQIVIYGECIAPPLDTLKRVVKAGDGTILATSPPYTRFFKSRIDFAIVSPGMPRVDMWIQEFLTHEIPCIVADYLVEYVCKPGYSLERHVQYNTHAWAQKSLENLVNRVEEVEDAKTPEDHSIDDVACQVCGSRDRGEEMLICGDESGSDGCGIGMHVDCLDPPLEGVPEEDWFCRECSQKRETKTISRGSNKRSSKSRK